MNKSHSRSGFCCRRKKTEYRKRQAKKRLEQEKATNGSAQPLLVPPPTIPKSRQSTSNPSVSHKSMPAEILPLGPKITRLQCEHPIYWT